MEENQTDIETLLQRFEELQTQTEQLQTENEEIRATNAKLLLKITEQPKEETKTIEKMSLKNAMKYIAEYNKKEF